jgi:hypothetical protein
MRSFPIFCEETLKYQKRAQNSPFSHIFPVDERLIYTVQHTFLLIGAQYYLLICSFKLYFCVQVVGPDPGAVAAAAWFNQIALAFS